MQQDAELPLMHLKLKSHLQLPGQVLDYYRQLGNKEN